VVVTIGKVDLLLFRAGNPLAKRVMMMMMMGKLHVL